MSAARNSRAKAGAASANTPNPLQAAATRHLRARLLGIQNTSVSIGPWPAAIIGSVHGRCHHRKRRGADGVNEEYIPSARIAVDLFRCRPKNLNARHPRMKPSKLVILAVKAACLL